MSIKWCNNLVTGLDQVDSQHKELIRRTNVFLDRLKIDTPIKELQQSLDDLTSFVYEHFMVEEKAMSETNYPNFVKHKQDHTNFINIVTNLEQRMLNELPLSSFKSEVNDKICAWLNGHIPIKDKEMSKFIKDQQENELELPHR